MEKVRFFYFKVLFLGVLAISLFWAGPAKAGSMDFVWYNGFVAEEKGTTINDGWWMVSRDYGRENSEDWVDYWDERYGIRIILEIDQDRNLVGELWGDFNDQGDVEIFDASMLEIQHNHIINHGHYDFEDEERFILDPAPRFPRFYNPGEGFLWNIDMTDPHENLQMNIDIDFTYLGQDIGVSSVALPGDDDLQDMALFALKEKGKIYEGGELMEAFYLNVQEAMAPGKGMVWEFFHESTSEYWDGFEEKTVESFVTDEIVAWGTGDIPGISADEIEEMRAILRGLPLAKNIEAVKKTGETTALTDLQTANIIFNWLESEIPELFIPTPRPTVEDNGIIYRNYPGTDVTIQTFQGDLYYVDPYGDEWNVGGVHVWLDFALGQN